jgi:hypothetical protein
VAAPPKPEDKTLLERDEYTGKRQDVKAIGDREAAAEVSQGSWRERAFQPRGVMSPEEILQGLDAKLAEARKKDGPRDLVLHWLRDEWLQYLRQAVEQAGGDCLDTWLSAALTPSKPYGAGIHPILFELFVTFGRMRAAPSSQAMLDLGREVITAVRRTLEAPSRRRCSFKVLERELEGKIDVDGLIAFLLSSDEGLAERAKEIGAALERIRAELRKMPGAKPDGMYSNFARLKAEARLIDGELKRRARAGR